jgi:hypothetical protein
MQVEAPELTGRCIFGDCSFQSDNFAEHLFARLLARLLLIVAWEGNEFD